MQSFVPTRQRTAINGTANLNHLVDEPTMTWLSSVKEDEMFSKFGPGISGNDIDGKGYNDMEWYFCDTLSGCVWGIGWRWGRTRMRGRSFGSGRADAEFFLTWLRRTLENNETISRENV